MHYEEYYEPILRENEHLGRSRENRNSAVGMAFGPANDFQRTNAWRKVLIPLYDWPLCDDRPQRALLTSREKDDIAEWLQALTRRGMEAAVDAAKPYVERWWNQTVRPRVTQFWRQATAEPVVETRRFADVLTGEEQAEVELR